MLRDMFKKTYTKIDMKYRAGEKESARTAEEDAPVIPAGLWKKCNKCGKPIYTDDVRANFYICPKCGGYFRVHAYRRIEMIADEGSFEEWDKFMQVSNPLSFPGYEKKLAAAREKGIVGMEGKDYVVKDGDVILFRRPLSVSATRDF